jgi:hypothetical protein
MEVLMAKAKKQDATSGTPAAKVEIPKRRSGKPYAKKAGVNKVTGKTIMGYNKARFDAMAGINTDSSEHEADRLRAILLEELKSHRDDKRTRGAAERRRNAMLNPSLPYHERSGTNKKQMKSIDATQAIAHAKIRNDENVILENPRDILENLPQLDHENMSVFAPFPVAESMPKEPIE